MLKSDTILIMPRQHIKDKQQTGSDIDDNIK